MQAPRMPVEFCAQHGRQTLVTDTRLNRNPACCLPSMACSLMARVAATLYEGLGHENESTQQLADLQPGAGDAVVRVVLADIPRPQLLQEPHDLRAQRAGSEPVIDGVGGASGSA